MDGFHTAIESIGTKAAELWAVISVETSGCGYFNDRRPQILYERHLFFKMTQGRFPVSDINSPDPGGYAGGVAEYDRLARAVTLDQNAAIQSASWGIGQVLGQNFKAAGFSDAASMVNAMCLGEDAQVLSVCNFLAANGLDRALRNHDWSGFARGYNGPNFAKFSYDTKLLQNFQKYSVGSLPDLTIRAAQLMLLFLNFSIGAVDGLNGPRTEAAVKAFQTAQALPVTGEVDDATLAALDAAVNPVSASAGVAV
jgi:N-acetylmuramidase/Putative peptidoglycan binding domain